MFSVSYWADLSPAKPVRLDELGPAGVLEIPKETFLLLPCDQHWWSYGWGGGLLSPKVHCPSIPSSLCRGGRWESKLWMFVETVFLCSVIVLWEKLGATWKHFEGFCVLQKLKYWFFFLHILISKSLVRILKSRIYSRNPDSISFQLNVTEIII